MQSLIDEDVLADVNKFYSYDDFINNLNSTVTDFIDYPGITVVEYGSWLVPS